MILIHTPNITDRILYIMNYVFEERLGVGYVITTSRREYIESENISKIIYDKEYIDEGLFFAAHTLLMEEDIKDTDLHEGICNNVPVLFSNTDKNAALNFDVFTAIFYLLSRYEEYLNKPLGKHNNYKCENSILFKLKAWDIPVIEQWIELLKEVLLKKFPALEFKEHKAKFGLSFDIDVAYAYKNKSVARTIGGLTKKILQLHFSEAKHQVLTLLNKERDIFDTYDYIFNSIKNKKPVFFFNMGLYGRFDKNPSFRNKKFKQLIKRISDKAIVGLHPSYASNTNKNLITIEKIKLEQIIKRPVSASRQHYLKLKLPHTYNNLIDNNITEDYTMGYSGNYGFRAGTCNSFLFFDLTKNKSTNFRLYPFVYMDVTLNNYLKLDMEEAKKIVSKLIETTCKYKGVFIPLWHNSTLCNCNEWKGWCEVFEHTLTEIDNKIPENLFN